MVDISNLSDFPTVAHPMILRTFSSTLMSSSVQRLLPLLSMLDSKTANGVFWPFLMPREKQKAKNKTYQRLKQAVALKTRIWMCHF